MDWYMPQALINLPQALLNSEVFMLVQITSQWQNLNTLTGQSVGTSMLVQSQASSRVYVKQQATQPAEGSVDAVILDFKDLWQVTAGSPITWVRVADTAGQLFVEVM